MADIETLPMIEALEFWGQKIPLDPEAFYSLAAEYRARAFTVSGLAKMDAIMAVQESLGKALVDGLDFNSWKRNTTSLFSGTALEGNLHRLDTIFRANIMGAYNAGRWKQQQEAKRFQPFGMYITVDDDRVRPAHAAHHGKVYPLDHPFWKIWYPPNGFGCRCRVMTLSAQDVKDLGVPIETESPKMLTPDKGWDHNPGMEPFKVSLDKYPEALKTQFLQNLRSEAVLNQWPLSLIESMLSPSDIQRLRALAN